MLPLVLGFSSDNKIWYDIFSTPNFDHPSNRFSFGLSLEQFPLFSFLGFFHLNLDGLFDT